MTEGTTTKESALLEDSTFNVITQIEKKADFLYSSVENTFAMPRKITSLSLSSCGVL
jgi:hypothetical protein